MQLSLILQNTCALKAVMMERFRAARDNFLSSALSSLYRLLLLQFVQVRRTAGVLSVRVW